MNTRFNNHLTLALLALVFTAEASTQSPNAWHINDNLTTFGVIEYITNLTPAQVSSADTNGWRYRIVSRLLPNVDRSAAQSMAFGNGMRRFYIFFDENSSGQLTAELLGGATYVLSSSVKYYSHEMNYDSVTSNATYRLNGVVISSWPGQVSAGQSHQVMWGANSSAGLGAMNYHDAEFEIMGQGRDRELSCRVRGQSRWRAFADQPGLDALHERRGNSRRAGFRHRGRVLAADAQRVADT